MRKDRWSRGEHSERASVSDACFTFGRGNLWSQSSAAKEAQNSSKK